MNVFWIQRYVYRANMFVITKDRSFKVFNHPKDILWLLDGIDSEAELDLYLQIFDSFNIRGKYLYMKTKNGYRVKKSEIGYPSSGNSLPHRTYILEIDKQGKMEKKLVKEYTEVFQIPFVQPDPSFAVPSNMVQWLLSHRGFYDPR